MNPEILTIVYDDGQIAGVNVWSSHQPEAVFVPLDRLLELNEKIQGVVFEVFGGPTK